MASEKRKILVRIWKPLVSQLNAKVEQACLRRDVYLARLIEREVEKLDEELTVANSADASRFIVSQLEQLDRKAVSVALTSKAIDTLEATCRHKGIVRDAFFNRMFFFLAANPKNALALLGIDDFYLSVIRGKSPIGDTYHRYELSVDDGSRNAFDVASEVLFDPFWIYRECISLAYDEEIKSGEKNPEQKTFHGLRFGEYLLKKRPGIMGLNLHLPDEEIPGSPSHQAASDELDKLLENL